MEAWLNDVFMSPIITAVISANVEEKRRCCSWWWLFCEDDVDAPNLQHLHLSDIKIEHCGRCEYLSFIIIHCYICNYTTNIDLCPLIQIGLFFSNYFFLCLGGVYSHCSSVF